MTLHYNDNQVEFDISDPTLTHLKRVQRQPKINYSKWFSKAIPYFALAVCFVIIISVWFGNQHKHSEVLSKNLLGEWKTSNKKYQNRFFKLEKRIVTIGIGGNEFELYRISNIRIDNVGNKDLYTIVCGDSLGLEFKLSFSSFSLLSRVLFYLLCLYFRRGFLPPADLPADEIANTEAHQAKDD